MKITRYTRYNSTRQYPVAQTEGEGQGVAHYTPENGALFTMEDATTGRQFWVRLDPIELNKLMRMMARTHQPGS